MVEQTNRRQLLTEAEAADYLGMAPQTLRNWRATRRQSLPFHKVGGRAVRYDRADLDAFIEANRKGGPAA